MTNEQIKKILDEAVVGSSHWGQGYIIDTIDGLLQMDEFGEISRFDCVYDVPGMHSLTDLREILSLRKENAKLKDAISIYKAENEQIYREEDEGVEE